MLPKTLWSHPELLQQATAIFGLPCVLDGKTGGCATWTEGPLHHVKIEDRADQGAATLTVRGELPRTRLSFLPLVTRHSPRLLSVQSDSAAKALAGLTLAVAVNVGLLSEELALAQDLFAKWSQAAESKRGAKRLMQLLQYSLAPRANKSWLDFEAFLADR